MSLKEFLKQALSTYFIVVTLILVSTYTLGMIYMPDQILHYDAFLYPLFYGLLGVIPMIVMYSKNELTIRQILVRKALQLVSLECILVFVVFHTSSWDEQMLPLVVSFIFSVFAIFVLVHIISFFLDYGQAIRMNQDLLLLKQEEE